RGYPLLPLAKRLPGVEVPVEAREVARADLKPDAVTWEENVTRRPQIDGEQIRFSRLHQLWRARRLPVAGPDNAIEEILGVAVRMHVHQFCREVGINRRRRRPQCHGNGSRNL